MKRKESTSIPKKKESEPVGMMEVKKIADLPNTEPPLYRIDKFGTNTAKLHPIF